MQLKRLLYTFCSHPGDNVLLSGAFQLKSSKIVQLNQCLNIPSFGDNFTKISAEAICLSNVSILL